MQAIQVLDGLTAKQEIFCREYAKTLSYPIACKAADYRGDPHTEGLKLMRKKAVKERVRTLIRAGATDAEYDVYEVINFLKAAAFLDVTDFFEDVTEIDYQGERFSTIAWKDFKKLKKWQRILITEIYTTKTGSIRVKFFPKEKAVDMLGRYYNLFGSEIAPDASAPSLVINFTKVENKQICEK